MPEDKKGVVKGDFDVAHRSRATQHARQNQQQQYQQHMGRRTGGPGGTSEADVSRRQARDRAYLDERARMTLAGNRVRPLTEVEQTQLAKLGALNADPVVRDYRSAIGWPGHARDRGRADVGRS